MKKLIEVGIVVVVLGLVSVFLFGCNESVAVGRQGVSSNELLKPQNDKTQLGQQWVKLYGTGDESVEHYNIAMNRLTAQGVGQIVNNQGKYIGDPNDPNSLAAKVARLEAEKDILGMQVDKLLATDHEKLDCNEFYVVAEKLVNKMIEENQKTIELTYAKLDLVEALEKRIGAMEAGGHDGIDFSGLMPTKPLKHCNEQWGNGCGWNYFECSLHSQTPRIRTETIAESVKPGQVKAEEPKPKPMITSGTLILSTPEYLETNGVPICPYCKKPTKRTGGGGMVTLAYHPPVYDWNGNNTNPDKNLLTSNWHCLECRNEYRTCGSVYNRFYYTDPIIIGD